MIVTDISDKALDLLWRIRCGIKENNGTDIMAEHELREHISELEIKVRNYEKALTASVTTAMDELTSQAVELQKQVAELKAGVDTTVAASTLGMIGGRSKSEAKAKAARENGKKGGRPKKKG